MAKYVPKILVKNITTRLLCITTLMLWKYINITFLAVFGKHHYKYRKSKRVTKHAHIETESVRYFFFIVINLE